MITEEKSYLGEAFNFSPQRRRTDISHKENPGKQQMTSELMGTRDGPKGVNFNSLSSQRFAAGI